MSDCILSCAGFGPTTEFIFRVDQQQVVQSLASPVVGSGGMMQATPIGAPAVSANGGSHIEKSQIKIMIASDGAPEVAGGELGTLTSNNRTAFG
jgi:hypothetical protein